MAVWQISYPDGVAVTDAVSRWLDGKWCVSVSGQAVAWFASEADARLFDATCLPSG